MHGVISHHFTLVPISFLPLCRRQEVQHLRRELNDSLRSIRSSDGACLSIASTQDIANLFTFNYIYIYLFRSQASGNMDRWKSRGGKSQRREEQKREDQIREQARGKKMQVREKVSKSRFAGWKETNAFCLL